MKFEYAIMDVFGQLMNLNRRKNTYYIQQDNPTQLTDMQAITLQYIMVESRKRDVFAKELEAFFDIKPSSVSSLIGYLESAGYIERQPLPEDRRMLKLIVTEKGRAVEDWVMSAIHRSITGGLSGFTEDEMKTLLSLLTKMQLNFKSIAERGEPYFAPTEEQAYSWEQNL